MTGQGLGVGYCGSQTLPRTYTHARGEGRGGEGRGRTGLGNNYIYPRADTGM